MIQKTSILISILFLSTCIFSQNKIVSGTDANITDFPWQIALESKNDFVGTPWTQSCGGSIIGSSWILTAGHCVFQMDTMALGTWDFRIRAGIELLSSTGGQTINVDEVFIHPQFDMMVTNEDYDIALLHLETPLNIDNINTKVISKVSQQDSIDGLTDNGVMGILSGWGCIDTGGTTGTDRLQYLEAPIYSLYDANQPSMWDGELEGMHLPIMPTGTSGVCFGDSGGPFVVPNEDTSAYLLAGVMSFIYPTYCGDTNYADILTRVSVYESWIDSIMGTYTDIPKMNQSSVNIYPNPSTGKCWVETPNEGKLTIYSINGQLLYQSEIQPGISKLELEFGSGLYIVQLKTEFNSVVQKLQLF